MSVYYEPVGLPIQAGVDLKTDTRALPGFKLAGLENGSFELKGQIRKRAGYQGYAPKYAAPPESDLQAVTPASILGYEEYDAATYPPRRYSFASNRWLETRGCAVRDDEAVVWTGTQLVARAAGGWQGRNSTVFLPKVSTRVVAQYQSKQILGDFASTGLVDVYAWQDSLLGPAYAVYDTATGACIVPGTALSGAPATTSIVKVVAMGRRVHIFCQDNGAHTVIKWTLNDATPYAAPVSSTFATLASQSFDIDKINETEAVIAYIKTAGGVVITYFNGDGTALNTPVPAGSVVDAGAVQDGAVAVSVHPTTRDTLVAWGDTLGALRCRMFTAAGLTLTTNQLIDTGSTVYRVTAAPRYLTNASDGLSTFQIFASWTAAALPRSNVFNLVSGGTLTSGGTRYRLTVVSRAFRVGNFCFVHLGRSTAYQASYYLFDHDLDFHGTAVYGAAAMVDFTTSPAWLPSIWATSGTQDQPQNLVQQWVAGYKTRVTAGISANAPSYTDEGLKRFEYDFGAQLRSAQAGRALYLQGLGLREYDGEAAYEQGFHQFPEETVVNPPSAGGSLTSGATYAWRVYYSRRNAQGEKVRSASLSFVAPSNPSGGNLQVVIQVPTIQATAFPGDIFIEVFRTLGNGTVFYRESSLDPSAATCPKSSFAVPTVSFTSTMADATLARSEIDPFSQGLLPNFPAPAGSTLAQGRGRVWVAGGELPPGVLVFSKVLESDKEVEFVSDGLQVTVDRASDDIRALAFVGDSVAVFKERAIYALEGDGPSNQGAGDYGEPRQISADTGAVSPFTVLVPGGAIFQSQLGLRLLSGGGVGYVGAEVEGELGTLTGAVVVPDKRRAVFTQDTGRALVFDYDQQQWSVFTNHQATGCALWQGRLFLSRADGWAWVEDPTVYTDNGVPYSMQITTGDFSLSSLENVARCRRAGFVGDVVSPHKLVVEFRMDEGPWRRAGSWSSQTYQGDLWGDLSVWGDGDAWGAYFFGVTGNLRLRKRLPRQVFSTVAFRLHDESDLAVDLGAGFALTQIILEVGKRRGLSRLGQNRS